MQIEIVIENLKVLALIGLLDRERREYQEIIINAKVLYSYNDQYIDYVSVVDLIRMSFKNRYLLLEDALVQISEHIMEKYEAIECFEMSIAKPDILPDCKVGARIVKNRNS